MGVTGLWTVVAPTARPTQLASLNRKRLAVDASIWIYQFLKAVRDKEGNALRNSHVVGFFRRICKLLYFGIKPVFVFDGGAPLLKRETVRKRARRREGRREDAARTAGKLLALQVARAAEEEDRRRKREKESGADHNHDREIEEELPPDQELVYVDELGMTAKERQAGRGFKKKDQYHLPDLDVSIESMGAPNDPRIMSQLELEDYARQFHSGEDVNLYDFSKIDFESPFFLSLPPGDRYNILNAARLRSRLRMGYSKEQLDGMFPDRMAFSKFQIERVKERNELTQRLMHINGMADDFLNQGGRIAGEKGKEYILVKNDGVDGGWALGVVSNKQGRSKDNAIDLEEEEQDHDSSDGSSEEDEFEDVAIEGLNRLPKSLIKKRKAVDYDASYEDAVEQIARKRKAVYDARKEVPLVRPTARPEFRSTPANPPDGEASLFVPDDKMDDDDGDELFEDVLPPVVEEEDDDLQRAIAMSLEKADDENNTSNFEGGFVVDNQPRKAVDQDDDDAFDFSSALAQSRRQKPHAQPSIPENPTSKSELSAPKFSGPLPFESINLGQSLLGKKKSKKIEEDLSGGFDRDLGDDAFRKERPPQPLPVWFNAAPSTKDLKHTVEVDDDDIVHDRYRGRPIQMQERIRRQDTKEVIDLDKEDEAGTTQMPIDIDDDTNPIFNDSQDMTQKSHADGEASLPSQTIISEESDHEDLKEAESVVVDSSEDEERRKRDEAREKRYELARQIAAENDSQEIKMSEVAELAQADPPKPTETPNFVPRPASPDQPVETDQESDFEQVEWSESEQGQPDSPGSLGTIDGKSPSPSHDVVQEENEDEDEGEDFEDVDMQAPPSLQQQESTVSNIDKNLFVSEENPSASQVEALPPINEPEFEYLSESEEELIRQLEIEAQEHARFANSLASNNNNSTTEQSMRDYENELKQLRTQQKKDRRDADEVTQAMVQECQALLRLFGLPYITAPMEAEAQCAELVRLGLVDGIVTDDSDIFLFGGTRIYKNMFNAAKYVECYLSSELEKEFLLDRRRLIRFAHLLGSDYTEGIPGVGPVTALEILTEFPTLDDFRDWCAKIQLGRPADVEGEINTPFRRKFRKTVQKKLFLPPGFPDVRVDEAYLSPEVDSNPEPFQWGVPDLDRLRSFLMATIGWSQDRTDEVLVPVIRDMNRRELEGTQSNITRFFSGGVGVGAVVQGRGIGGRNTPAGATGGVGGLAVGGETVGGTLKEPTAPRNRTGKESGRMRNAFKRLRGEAERRRKGNDMDFVDDVGAEEDKEGLAAPAFAEDGIDADAEDEDDGDNAVTKDSSRRQRGNNRKKTTTKQKKRGSRARPQELEDEDGEESERI
ncbi:hypothetical protein PV10_02437 [Exophiala mesophila]|uniref:Uncharacterized protein n=1 Tax=Exophiala mesophila TaxID=212818 RepID=A0A0D1ZJ95_EXOME|nr:uncharacterized protein PV10_02437 [Exophiala mesophila]KIV94697.1 hypothetical protein PV10_02437 [Exophiala mesophila]